MHSMLSMCYPLVTIIVPFFNPGRYFAHSLRSLEALEYKNIEFIFVDDGSTDDSASLLLTFNRDYKLAKQDNKGVLRLAETLNAGLSMASGKYVQMFPSDDIIYAHKLSRQVDILEQRDDVVLIFSDMDIINENGLTVARSYAPRGLCREQSYSLNDLREYLLINYFLSQPTTLIRSHVLLDIGGFLQPDGLYAEDMPTHLELLRHGSFYYQSGSTAGYRIHSQQMTNRHATAMMISDFRYVREWAEANTPNSLYCHFRLQLLVLFKRYFVLFRVMIADLRIPNDSILLKLGLTNYDIIVYLLLFLSTPIFLARKIFPETIKFRSRKTCKP